MINDDEWTGQHLASASDESRTILSSISDMALFNNNWDLRKDEEQVNINNININCQLLLENSFRTHLS